MTAKTTEARATLEGLRTGDVIFQESSSRQSEMVRALTRSRWTHMGVIFIDGKEPRVLEASSPVKYTPLRQWIARGRQGHFVIKRLQDGERRVTPEVVTKMRGVAANWIGLPYDPQFRWDDDALYCSELVYKLYERAADVRLGRRQTAADMNLSDERVKRALAKRFAAGQFDKDETVITPSAIIEDEQLITVQER